MKYCLFAPRVFIPRNDFEKWAVPDPERTGRELEGEIVRAVSDAPSARRFAFSAGAEEEAAGEVASTMFFALEDEWMEKLQRGPILVERKIKGNVRYGIVAMIDLEAYTHVRGTTSQIMPAQEGEARLLKARLALREKAPLEFPSAVVFYRDKKHKILSRLLEEDLEVLYDFDLIGGGHVKGYFIPEPFASWALEEMHSRGEPAFAVAEGVEEIDAAKIRWEALKPTLDREEVASHPARFALVELENILDDGVEIYPVHRIAEEVDAETLIDYLSRNMKVRRDGNILSVFAKGADTVAICDHFLEEYVRQNGGKLGYVYGAAELKARAAEKDTVGILMNTIDKEDIFPAMKDGKTLPVRTFCIGRAREGRYLLEGREIGYD